MPWDRVYTVNDAKRTPHLTDAGPSDGDVLTYDSGTGEWGPVAPGAGSGAPTTADYLVGTAQGGLSAEIVVGTTPGGELGGTWASPTVDATHSGSAHTDFIAKAIVDAKGDLIAATAADTVAKVTVGADGTYLKADSGASAGVSWDTPSGTGSVATDAIWDAAGDLAIGTGANTAAKLAIGNAGAVLARINGAVTWNAGTSFPTAATGDRYFRTDRGREYYYDGSQWLTTQEFTCRTVLVDALMPYSTSPVNVATAPTDLGDNGMYCTRYSTWAYVSTTNDGTKFWTCQLKSRTATGTATSIGSAFDTSADTAARFTKHAGTLGVAVTSDTNLVWVATKTSTPGALYLDTIVYYRLIG